MLKWSSLMMRRGLYLNECLLVAWVLMCMYFTSWYNVWLNNELYFVLLKFFWDWWLVGGELEVVGNDSKILQSSSWCLPWLGHSVPLSWAQSLCRENFSLWLLFCYWILKFWFVVKLKIMNVIKVNKILRIHWSETSFLVKFWKLEYHQC